MSDTESLCLCFSGKEYQNCCRPYHRGALPENALLLMRSRFCAYVLNIPEYIVETTHPASPQYSDNKFSWKRSISQFSKSLKFLNLEILDFKEKDNIAVVTFTATLSQNSHDATFTERSTFEKKENRWFYLSGRLSKGRDTRLIIPKPFRLLPLAYYGDPILRMKTGPVEAITASTKALIEEMVETMDIYDGIGLAAPQIHQSLRLFVTRAPVEIGENQYDTGEVKVYINPQLSSPSSEMWFAPEGCLSIPTLRFMIERPKEVTVDYTTIEGKKIQERVSGWEAKVIQHEFDHIEGILYTDRLTREEKLKIAPHLKNLERRIQDFK